MSKEIRDVFKGAPHRVVERRRGLDRRGKIGLALSIIGWALWTAGICMVSMASPQSSNFFDRFMDKSYRTGWTTGYLYVAEVLWAIGVLLCLMSLFQFRKRYRRRADKKHAGIITALIINAIFLIGFGIAIFVMDFS
jgi:uncharacterized membrane protein